MKKKVIQRVFVTAKLVSLCCITVLLTQCTTKENPALGKDQLVDALDAAYIRVLSSGKWREISKPLGKLVVNIADCYPDPETAPFPEKPTGVLAAILNNKKIRVGTYPITGIGSNNIFSPTTEKILRAVLDEMGKAYNLSTPIEIVPVIVNPPSSTLLFTRLNNGEFDITDLNAALGAKALGQRRRKIARFTCTVMASGQFLQVLENSPYKTLDDVAAAPNSKLCAGSLSIQLARAYFPGHKVTFSTGDDIQECGQGVLDGTFDAYVYFDPAPVKPGLRSIDIGIVTGVPFWVAGDEKTSESTSTVPGS